MLNENMLKIECRHKRQIVESIVVYQTPNVQKYISKTAIERHMNLKSDYFYFLLIGRTFETVRIEIRSRKL